MALPGSCEILPEALAEAMTTPVTYLRRALDSPEGGFGTLCRCRLMQTGGATGLSRGELPGNSRLGELCRCMFAASIDAAPRAPARCGCTSPGRGGFGVSGSCRTKDGDQGAVWLHQRCSQSPAVPGEDRRNVQVSLLSRPTLLVGRSISN